MESKMSNTTLWAVIICVSDHDHEDGLVGALRSQTRSCMNTISKGNSWHYQWSTPVVSGDMCSINNGFMTESWRQVWPEDQTIKTSHCPRQWKEQSTSSNPQSDMTSEEHLKILLRIRSSIHELLLYVLSVNMHCMSSWWRPHSQCAHRRVVATFGDLIQY